jgi:TRAP transporter 4TM/12TM fusion protein
MFGMMSGSSVANVAFTGTFTIPLMKRYGYKSEFAAGVEAAASTGGQLMPPIMGTAAFIMADYTAIPYVHIMVAAILPAILYYMAVFLRVHFKAKQEGLVRPSAAIVGRTASVKELIPRLIPLVIVFAVLMVGLFTWTPTRAAVVTIAAIIPLSFLRRETWLTPRKILDGLVDATRSFLPIGAALIAIGILMAVATVTGIGLKFSELMLVASGESLALLLLATAVACIIMGMGIGGTAVYVFVALMIGPALVKLGVPLLPAHLFIFYFAQLQSITPPVCMASYTAASIAKANPTKTALTGVSLGIVGFLTAFLFVLHPELLLIGSPASILIMFSLMAIGLLGLTFALGGYINRQLSLWERALFLISAAVIFAQWNYALSLVGVAMIGVLIFVSITLKRRSQTSPKED